MSPASPTLTRDRWAVLALGLVTAILYAPNFGRGFVSEDFLILRLFEQALESGRFFSLAWDHFTGPWLGIPLVSFYRPVSSLFLQVEAAVLGTFSAGYLGVHLSFHFWNALQVRGLLARGLGDTEEPGTEGAGPDLPWIGAALFAVYPLHPNTVVFIASFATLIAVSLMLFSLRAFLAGRNRTSLGAFVLALGCYEQAVVLPACLLGWAVLVPDHSDASKSRNPRRHLPFWALAIGYLVLRRLLLGHTVGGYDSFRSRLADPFGLVESAVTGLGRLLLPSYPAGPAEWIGTAAVVSVAVVATVSRVRSASRLAGLALLGLFLALVSLAPFSFVGIVPGNGRYAYFAAVGTAMTVSSLLAGAARRSPESARWIPIAVGLMLCATYGARLTEISLLYREAGLQAEMLRRQIAELPADGHGVVFVADAPRFLTLGGAPAAQVFHWGLADAAMPPFTPRERRREVFPLPALGDRALAPLAHAGLGRIFRVDGARLRALGPAPLPEELDLRLPPSPNEPLRISTSPGAFYRLVVVTRGSYHVEELAEDPAGSVVIELPRTLLDSMATLYRATDGRPSPAFWWVEERRAADGALLAAGPVRTINRTAP